MIYFLGTFWANSANVATPLRAVQFKNLGLSHVGILSWGNLIDPNSYIDNTIVPIFFENYLSLIKKSVVVLFVVTKSTTYVVVVVLTRR